MLLPFFWIPNFVSWTRIYSQQSGCIAGSIIYINCNKNKYLNHSLPLTPSTEYAEFSSSFSSSTSITDVEESTLAMVGCMLRADKPPPPFTMILAFLISPGDRESNTPKIRFLVSLLADPDEAAPLGATELEDEEDVTPLTGSSCEFRKMQRLTCTSMELVGYDFSHTGHSDCNEPSCEPEGPGEALIIHDLQAPYRSIVYFVFVL